MLHLESHPAPPVPRRLCAEKTNLIIWWLTRAKNKDNQSRGTDLKLFVIRRSPDMSVFETITERDGHRQWKRHPTT
jgi:hypothetical protein